MALHFSYLEGRNHCYIYVMKPVTLICLSILLVTSAIAQDDTAAVKNSIRKEIKNLEETTTLLKTKRSQLEQENRYIDTLIESLRRQQFEVESDLLLTEQVYKDLQQQNRELGMMISNYQKLQKDSKTKLNATPGKLTKTEREQQNKDLAEIGKALSGYKLYNDSLQKDLKKVMARIEKKKKESATRSKDVENSKESRKSVQAELDKADRLIGSLEEQLAALKQLLDK